MTIQRAARQFIYSLRIRKLKLYKIRKNLLLITLTRALSLYIKKRRISKLIPKIRGNIVSMC